MKDSEKTQIILNTLKRYFSTWGRERSNIIFPELRLGSGYCGVAQRRIDLFVINSGAGNTTTSFEIKVSKGDFKHETDLKQRGARLYSNYFYYVTPKGLLNPEDIPIWAGLWELDIDKYDSKKIHFDEIVPAPLHSKAMPSWGLICSMVRHVNREIGLQHLKETLDENNKLKVELNRMANLLGRIARKEDNPFLEFELQKYKDK